MAQPVEISTTRPCKAAASKIREALSPSHGAQIKVIGVICSGDLAVHRSKVKEALQRGMEAHPEAVWVCIESKSDRMTHDAMISLGIDPVVLPLNEEWRRRGHYDLRRTWRDLEMGSLCDELIIFHKASSSSPWRERATKSKHLVIVDIGKKTSKEKA